MYKHIINLILLCLVLSSPKFTYGQNPELEQNLFETMGEGDKAVIVAIHVGASDSDSRHTLNRLNERMRQVYPEYAFREAWTSRDLIRLFSSDGVSFMLTPEELFGQLQKEGFTHVLVQSSCITNSDDMQYIRYVVDAARRQFKQLRLGEPLLADANDYEDALAATAKAYGKAKETNVLLCDSGTGYSNPQYTMLDYTMHDKNFHGWHVGSIDGYPSFDSLMRQLKQEKAKRIHIIPFTFASSNREHNENLEEWKHRLQQAGYKVTTELRCLGDIDDIIDIFERHLRHAAQYRTYTVKELKLLRR